MLAVGFCLNPGFFGDGAGGGAEGGITYPKCWDAIYQMSVNGTVLSAFKVLNSGMAPPTPPICGRFIQNVFHPPWLLHMKVGASAFNTDKIHTFVCCLSEAPFGFNKHTAQKLVPLSVSGLCLGQQLSVGRAHFYNWSHPLVMAPTHAPSLCIATAVNFASALLSFAKNLDLNFYWGQIVISLITYDNQSILLEIKTHSNKKEIKIKQGCLVALEIFFVSFI